jgi:hypothetical protein
MRTFSQPLARPRARGLEPDAIDVHARGNVERLQIGVTERQIRRAHLLARLTAPLWQLQHAEPPAVRGGDSHFTRPRARRRVHVADGIGLEAVVAGHVGELDRLPHRVVAVDLVAHDLAAESHIEVPLVRRQGDAVRERRPATCGSRSVGSSSVTVPSFTR